MCICMYVCMYVPISMCVYADELFTYVSLHCLHAGAEELKQKYLPKLGKLTEWFSLSSFFFSLCLSLSVSLSRSLSVCLTVSLSVSLCLSVCLSSNVFRMFVCGRVALPPLFVLVLFSYIAAFVLSFSPLLSSALRSSPFACFGLL